LGTQAALLGKFSKNNNRQLLSFFLLDDDWGSVLQESTESFMKNFYFQWKKEKLNI
jgi:hypothetical protein